MKRSTVVRIAIAGLAHEALTFSPEPTRLVDFDVWDREDVLAYLGVSGLAGELDIELVPVLIAETRSPGGCVEESAYCALRDRIVDGIVQAGDVDGVCLVLHGALLVDNISSGETDLVRAIRVRVGDEVRIAARLDLHAILTDEFVRIVDVWTSYRTAPHTDIPETLRRAMTLLVRTLRSGSRPHAAFVRLPLLLPGEQATTDVEPMRSLLEQSAVIARQPGILTSELLVGFGWADAPHSGSCVCVIAEDAQHLHAASRAAEQLAAAMWARRSEFSISWEVAGTIDEAIDRSLVAAESTVFATDSGDNLTAGAAGDTPAFLARLLERRVPDAVFAAIPDAGVYRRSVEAGVGGTLTVRLGGKIDTQHGQPVQVTAVVEHVHCPQPNTREVGVATLRVGGLHIIVSELRKVFSGVEDFRSAGLNPLEHKLVVVKLGYLLPELRAIAPREILTLSPGYADMDLKRLPFRHVKRPIYPLDQNVDWAPVAVTA
ncbi:MAG: M81 family metallopeptidase [Chloroflexota bacterium]